MGWWPVWQRPELLAGAARGVTVFISSTKHWKSVCCGWRQCGWVVVAEEAPALFVATGATLSGNGEECFQVSLRVLFAAQDF